MWQYGSQRVIDTLLHGLSEEEKSPLTEKNWGRKVNKSTQSKEIRN
jgi:hypothetical protein